MNAPPALDICPPASTTTAIDQALSRPDVLSLKAYYQQWSSQYDADVGAQQYRGPAFMLGFMDRLPAVTALSRHCRVMDACCGTGLVGRELQKRGYQRVDGCDLSPAMIEHARASGAYRQLHADVDLLQALPAALRHRYDLVLCCGAFIPGHLPGAGLDGLLQMTRPGGLVVFSVRSAYFDDSAFLHPYRALQRRYRLRLLGSELHGPYLHNVDAHYLALQVN